MTRARLSMVAHIHESITTLPSICCLMDYFSFFFATPLHIFCSAFLMQSNLVITSELQQGI